MKTDKLIETLQHDENLVPKEVLQELDKDKLVGELEQVLKDHRDQLEKDKLFQRNYILFINYLYSLSLTETTKATKKLFSDKFINEVLSLPEPS